MTEATRACRRCGTDISALRRGAVWCSQCPKRVPQNLAERPCETCGSTFQPKRKDAVCCSRSCNMKRLNQKYWLAGRQEAPILTCIPCGKDFKPRRSDQRFCSETCGARSRYKPAHRPARPCAYCGHLFTPPRAASTVCSRVCSRRVTYARKRTQRIADAVAWGRANREARAAITNQYKARRRKNEQEAVGSVGVSTTDWIKMVRRYRHCCAYCGAPDEIHMEHVIPLSRGGRHAIGNVLPACAGCNLNKQADFVSEWKLRKARVARIAMASAGGEAPCESDSQMAPAR